MVFGSDGGPIVLDTRLLLSAHPLISMFDANTARFKGTSSEPIMGEYEGVDAFVEKIKETEDALLKITERLRKRLKAVSLTERIEVEREFMLEKRMLEAKLEVMKMRAYMARLVPVKIGMTPYSSIVPQVLDMSEAIKKVVSILMKKHKTQMVIDVADLLPHVPKPALTEVLLRNKQKDLADISKPTPEKMNEWILLAKEYWAHKEGVEANPVPYGAKDVRLEALKLMEEEVKGYKTWDW